MGYSTDGLSNYVQERRDEIARKAVLGAKTIDLVSWMVDVKTKAQMNTIETDVVLQNGEGCGFSAQGDTRISKREIETKLVKVNMDYCAKDLLRAWTQYEVRIAADAEALPFEGYIMEEIAEKLSAKVEEIFWKGDEGLGINGILKEYEVAGQGFVNTKGMDAYRAIMAVYNEIPLAVLDKAVIFVGKDLYRQFIQNMVEKNFYHYNAGDATDEFVLPATTTKVIAVNGLNGTGAVVGTATENLVYGTDITNADEIVDVWYSKDDRMNKIAIEFNMGANFRFPEEIKIGKATE